MRISDYDYQLPDKAIAYHPPEVRGTSRLLVLDKSSGATKHRHYPDMLDYLSAGDLVVLNDTHVLHARLLAHNNKGQDRELFLLESHGNSNNTHERQCLYRGKLVVGEQLTVDTTVVTVKTILDGGMAIITSTESIPGLADQFGKVPLPPYIKRDVDTDDTERYQTVFARHKGSVAAPTASLNFTESLEQALLAKGVRIAYLTLHVGLGTFLPIRSDTVEEHNMHSEYYEIPVDTIELIRKTKASGGNICAVGTTVTRTLEYAADDLLQGDIHPLNGEANIFIYPGYEFKLVDKLLTNFHAPRSTVLMLAAAFAGWPHLESAYQEALSEGYKFLSYGDSMLIK